MLDDVDHLACGVGVGDGALVGHGPQLPKSSDQFLQRGVRDVGPVLFQHGQLRLGLGIVHGMAAKDVTCSQHSVLSFCPGSFSKTPSQFRAACLYLELRKSHFPGKESQAC